MILTANPTRCERHSPPEAALALLIGLLLVMALADALELHGYCHPIPAAVRNPLRGKTVEVVVKMHGDRSGGGYVESRANIQLP